MTGRATVISSSLTGASDLPTIPEPTNTCDASAAVREPEARPVSTDFPPSLSGRLEVSAHVTRQMSWAGPEDVQQRAEKRHPISLSYRPGSQSAATWWDVLPQSRTGIQALFETKRRPSTRSVNSQDKQLSDDILSRRDSIASLYPSCEPRNKNSSVGDHSGVVPLRSQSLRMPATGASKAPVLSPLNGTSCAPRLARRRATPQELSVIFAHTALLKPRLHAEIHELEGRPCTATLKTIMDGSEIAKSQLTGEKSAVRDMPAKKHREETLRNHGW